MPRSTLYRQGSDVHNHCEFCFIHQLPKGMRRSLYLKDDDYRLSFPWNFTTLTRFTELDLERVITSGSAPSMCRSTHELDGASRHPQEPARCRLASVAAGAARSRIEVHGQIVAGVNDADVLDDTLAGVLERFQVGGVAVVPLGISKFSTQPRMRGVHPRRGPTGG